MNSHHHEVVSLLPLNASCYGKGRCFSKKIINGIMHAARYLYSEYNIHKYTELVLELNQCSESMHAVEGLAVYSASAYTNREDRSSMHAYIIEGQNELT